MSLLEIRGLRTSFELPAGPVPAVDGVDLALNRGQTLALVGESGSGKSVLSLSVMGLVPHPGRIVGGSIRFDGTELTHLPAARMRALRGNRLAMVFQDPMTSLNPVLRVGGQIAEVLRLHCGLNRGEALRRAVELLEAVGIPDPERRVRAFPHQLSGGMRQRVMIAMALACDPDLLIADEPTTALDVTIQAQILDLLKDLQRRTGAAILFVTHDLGVVAEVADRVAVMYAGRIVEEASAGALFATPRMPYTAALMASVPRLDGGEGRLAAIEGAVPSPTARPSGCAFHPRCGFAVDACRDRAPGVSRVAEGHSVRCHRWEEVDTGIEQAG